MLSSGTALASHGFRSAPTNRAQSGSTLWSTALARSFKPVRITNLLVDGFYVNLYMRAAKTLFDADPRSRAARGTSPSDSTLSNPKYEEAVSALFTQLPMFQRERPRGLQERLDCHEKVCAAIGNPQQRLKFVHVAGTNGKGTVCVTWFRRLLKTGHRVDSSPPHIWWISGAHSNQRPVHFGRRCG